jgi:hypothetical protein
MTRRFQIASTISFFARRQPPKSEMRKGSSMCPNSAWPAFKSSRTLRKPYRTKIRCASSLHRNCVKASMAARSRA